MPINGSIQWPGCCLSYNILTSKLSLPSSTSFHGDSHREFFSALCNIAAPNARMMNRQIKEERIETFWERKREFINTCVLVPSVTNPFNIHVDACHLSLLLSVETVNDRRVVVTHMGSTCHCELEEEAQRKITPRFLSLQGLVFPLLTSL